MRREIACAAAAAISFSAFVGASARADYPTFNQLPSIYTQNPQGFGNLFNSANSQTVNVAVFGDSQETSPAGSGLVFIPQLNYDAWQKFGNAPETPIGTGGSYYSGAPYAQWLIEGANPSPGTQPGRLSGSQVLPGMSVVSSYTLDGSAINGQQYGQMFMLTQDASNLAPYSGISTANNYFNTNGRVVAQIFAATNAASGEISYAAHPIGGNQPYFFAPKTTAGTLTLGLQSTTPAVLSGLTAPLDFNGQKYMQIEVGGTSPNTLTDLVGARFINLDHPQGMVFTNLAAGGYQTSSFLANHADAGPMYKGLGFNAAIIHTGSNDAGDSVTAVQFEQDQKSLISSIRAWTGDPNYKVILISDPDRNGLTTAQRTQFDQYVGAQMDIAGSDPNVMVVNDRLLASDIGWSVGSPQFDTLVNPDGIHYTAAGATDLAQMEFNAMTSVPEPAALGVFGLAAAGLLLRRRLTSQ
ncbi:MAG TPA: PEP-CTERM sorting domain-containing protein [Tepidisphaeraceae bacterium]|nr:PEP-CTERM sorting domain-containing protein [Tepidisphaeraceae bacterium]